MKIKKSIFMKLMGSFILYVVVIILTFVFCLWIEAMFITEGDFERLVPQNIIDENGNVVNLETAQKVGGWVEEIDENYNVINVYGNKRTDKAEYSADDLFELTSIFGNSQYIGFFIQPEKSTKKYVCIYDRNTMETSVTVNLDDVGKFGTPNIFFIFFPLSVLEIVLISLYLKKKIKNPLSKIVEGMERLKSGDSSARIDIRTEAEFENIVDTFNVMAKQLENEKAEKERLINNKNKMLLELSHDIKTPVATIKSYANALESGLVPDEKISGTYRIIDAKASRVQQLTDDMFMMLKMDNPDYRLNFENVNLCEYLRQLCAEYYDEITEAGFDFIIDIPETEIIVRIDKNLFSRVVGNLLSNAKKYDKSGKVISVKLTSESGKITFAICDDGNEIDNTFVQQMFNAFSRGDKARKTEGGTGLGLAISKIIIEKHNGNIRYFRYEKTNVFEVTLAEEWGE